MNINDIWRHFFKIKLDILTFLITFGNKVTGTINITVFSGMH